MFALEENLRGVEIIPFCLNFKKNRPSRYSSYFLTPPAGYDNLYFRDFQLSTMGKIKYGINNIYNKKARQKLELLIEKTNPDLALFLNVTYFSHSIIDACKTKGVPIVWRLSDFNLICPSYLLLRQGRVCEACLERGRWAAIYYRCAGYQKSFAGALIKTMAHMISNLRKLFDYVSFFVAPSRFTLDRMIKAGFDPKKVVHLPTFVDIPEEITRPVEGPVQVLYAGRISPEKGIDTLIGALPYLKRRDYSLRLAGSCDSQYAKSVMASVPPDLVPRVEFLGYCSQKQMERLYRESHIVVVPSICYENMPNVALEAMAFGRPLVASRLGSLVEIVINGETGLLFEAGNAEDLATKLNSLIDSRQKIDEMGVQAVKYTRKNHTVEKHLAGLISIFQSCVNRT
jgi:glycosyltransferase involved in cell wall biosynthesis